MYERAKYFSSKFIRNGIAGSAISAILIYSAITKGEEFNTIVIIFPIVAFVWLYFGLRINKILKEKKQPTTNDASEIRDVRISFKSVQAIFSIVFVVVLLLVFRHWKFADYLAILIVVAYAAWLYSQMKMLNDYFKS